MDRLGINWIYLGFQCIPGLILLAWLVLSVAALVGLRQRGLAGLTQAVWALLIVITPILGAVAFWIVNPAPSRAPDELPNL